MTSPDPSLPTDRREAVREAGGLLLIVAGVIGLIAAAYITDPLLAFAVLCGLMILLGVRMSMTNTEE